MPETWRPPPPPPPCPICGYYGTHAHTTEEAERIRHDTIADLDKQFTPPAHYCRCGHDLAAHQNNLNNGERCLCGCPQYRQRHPEAR